MGLGTGRNGVIFAAAQTELIALFAIVLLACPPPPAPGPAAIEIDLSRPLRPGQVFSYAAVGRSHRETVVSTRGAVVNEVVRGRRCELAAALSVDAVRDDGLPLELSLRVFRLVVRDHRPPDVGDGEGAAPADAGGQPLPAGTELVVRFPDRGAGEPTVSRRDGLELEGDVVEALLLVIPGPAGTRDDDVLFGKEGAARVGERWPIAASPVSAALAEGGIEVDAGRLSGEVALLSHDPEAGTHSVEVAIVGDRAGVPLPDGYVTRSGTLRVELSRTLPDDPGSAPLRESARYSLQAQAMGREGERLMVVDLAYLDSRVADYREIKASELVPPAGAPKGAGGGP